MMIDVFGFVVGLGVVGWVGLALAVLLLGWLSFLFSRSDRDGVYALLFLFYGGFLVSFAWGFATWLGVVLLIEMCFRGLILWNVAGDDNFGGFMLGWLVPLSWLFLDGGDYL